MRPEVLDNAVERVLANLVQRAGGPSGGQWVRQERATSSTPSTPYYTGPTSLFGQVGLERDVISTRVNPFGLADRLPVQMTNVMYPQFAYFTGFAAATGSEPSGVCDDPPTAGAGASCIQTAQFGRFSRQSRVLEVNHLGQQINRGEFQDIRILNGPLVGGTGGLAMPGTPTNPSLFNEAAMRMLEVGVDFQAWLARMLYEGNPSNNTGGGGYKEFPGLDILVGTGHVDANTNTACTALDSVVSNFQYGNVSIGGNTVATSFVTGLTRIMRYLRLKAAGQNMGETRWVMVMRPGLFYELTALWPCTYATYRCAVPSGGSYVVNVDGMDMAQMRDDMRNGNYLIVDGIRIDVILDNMIREDSNTNNSSVTNGSFASDIYILPLTIRGGMPVLYWEAFDYRTSLEILGSLAPGAGSYYWTDGGRYLWHLKPPTNWCIQVLGKIEPRLILRTPHLAARITNVVYQTPLHEPDPDVTDPYFVRGGVTTGRTLPTLNAQWGTVS